MTRKKHTAPTSVVKLGPVDESNPGLLKPSYYRDFGLSTRTSKVLSYTGLATPEFYWLDKKWIKHYTEGDKAIQSEIEELLGGFFINLSLEDQCELLKVPLFSGLYANSEAKVKRKARWYWQGELVGPEQYVENIVKKEFEIAINDEGEHLKVWRTRFANLYEESLRRKGRNPYPADFNSQAYHNRTNKGICKLAKSYDDDAFFQEMRNQIQIQVDGSWWPKHLDPDAAVKAAMSWGRTRLIEFPLHHHWGAGYPDLMLYRQGRHTLLEVKTTDRLHQSQAHFIRNTARLELDCRIVKLVPVGQHQDDNTDAFLSWIGSCT